MVVDVKRFFCLKCGRYVYADEADVKRIKCCPFCKADTDLLLESWERRERNDSQ